jgi:hypothetical protein
VFHVKSKGSNLCIVDICVLFIGNAINGQKEQCDCKVRETVFAKIAHHEKKTSLGLGFCLVLKPKNKKEHRRI